MKPKKRGTPRKWTQGGPSKQSGGKTFSKQVKLWRVLTLVAGVLLLGELAYLLFTPERQLSSAEFFVVLVIVGGFLFSLVQRLALVEQSSK